MRLSRISRTSPLLAQALRYAPVPLLAVGLLTSTSTLAQAPSAALYPRDYVLLQGVWTDPVKGHRYIFKPAGPSRLSFAISSIATGEELARGELAPVGRGSMQGEFTTGPASVPKQQHNSGEVNFSVDTGGGFYIVVSRGNLLGETREASHNSSRSHIKREVTLPADVQKTWVGEWQTSRGVVSFKPIGGDVIAAYIPSERDKGAIRVGRLGSRYGVDVALLPAGGDAYGTWEQIADGVRYGDAVLRLAPDGKSFSGYYTDVTTSGDRIAWTGTRATPESTVTPLPTSVVAKYEGDWQTLTGPMQIVRRGPGAVMSMHLNGTAASIPLSLSPDRQALEGVFTRSSLSGSTRFRLVVRDADGSIVLGREVRPDGQLGATLWTFYSEARRTGTPPAPNSGEATPPAQHGPVAEQPQTPVPQPGSVVAPPASPQAPVVPPSFKPLNRVDVRVDRVVVARGYPTHQVHAFVTVKNASPGLQYFTSGFLKALLTDADGVSLERSQPYRASAEPAELFMSTPIIQPGGELKVRYVFTPAEGAQLTSITLSEGDKRAEFPVNGLGATNNESIP